MDSSAVGVFSALPTYPESPVSLTRWNFMMQTRLPGVYVIFYLNKFNIMCFGRIWTICSFNMILNNVNTNLVAEAMVIFLWKYHLHPEFVWNSWTLKWTHMMLARNNDHQYIKNYNVSCFGWWAVHTAHKNHKLSHTESSIVTPSHTLVVSMLMAPFLYIGGITSWVPERA